jgi:hypothetical protein
MAHRTADPVPAAVRGSAAVQSRRRGPAPYMTRFLKEEAAPDGWAVGSQGGAECTAIGRRSRVEHGNPAGSLCRQPDRATNAPFWEPIAVS